MEFSDLNTAWMVMASALTAVVLIGGAAAVIARFWSWATKPSMDNSERLDHIEDCLKADNRRIKDLEDAIGLQDKQNKLLMRGVMQMMTHMLDGNHMEDLKEVRDEFQDFLINR